MDRFNNYRIFERLREVNTLVNIQLAKEGKKPLRFFYLLRDDIFVSKDRTKFFDYIVPIVPVVDSSNSYEKFISHFKEAGIFEAFDESFLQGLALYVDEMRILKNIYNEYIIYYEKLKEIEPDHNKMLAMVTYKNIFPRDFGELQLGRGLVYSLFDKKDKFIQDEIERFKILEEQKRAEIEQLKKEHLLSVEELKDVFAAKRNRMPSQNQYNQRDRREALEQQYSAEEPVRKQAIENKFNNRLPILEKELSSLEQEIVKTNNKQLKDIISRDNIDTIFQITTVNEIGEETRFNEIKSSDYFRLLKYLIRNGYIDETYASYMTYFYENSISRADKIFLRSITDRIAKEPSYKLNNPALVTKRLQIADFDQKEILNFDLLEYLLKTPSNQNFLERFLLQLRETKNLKFISTYFDMQRELPKFVVNLNLQWPGVFAYALENDELTDAQIRKYSIYTLYYSEPDNVKAVNLEESLAYYISKYEDYLDIENPDVSKLMSGFKLLAVSFKNIEMYNEKLLAEVYKNSLYEINFKNISLMLGKFYSVSREYDIHHQNYSYIMSNAESPLANYVNKNISNYLDVVLENSADEIRDSGNEILLILNNSDLSTEQKLAYIYQLKTTIELLVNVENKDLWEALLNQKVAKYSIETIMAYFGNNDDVLDDTLINYINDDDTALNFSTIEENYTEEEVYPLFGAVIVCNELLNNKYQEIITALGYPLENFDMENISDEKLKILIDANIIHMTAESLEFIREHYTNQNLYFIEKNIDEYADIMTFDMFDFDELLQILTWNIDDDIKLKLLEFTNNQISVIDKNYAIAVTTYILNNNLNTSDRPALYESYVDWPPKIQDIIIDLAMKQLASIIQAPGSISVKLLKDILNATKLNRDQKINLFVSTISKYDIDESKEILNLLDLAEYIKLFEPRSRPRFEVNPVNEKLLRAFMDAKIIQNFEEDQNKQGCYKVTK